MTSQNHYQYQYLPEFFAVSKWEDTVNGSFALAPPFKWDTFKARIEELKASCAENEEIKVLFASRHGEGEHNVLGPRYGMHPDDANIKYPILDAPLTDRGRQQAVQLALALKREAQAGMPLPAKWFTSPMQRAAETAGISWGWLFHDGPEVNLQPTNGDHGHGVPAVIVENLREHVLLHQCNQRRTLSSIRQDYPTFSFSPQMPEQDLVFAQQEMIERNEYEEERDDRLRLAVETIFDQSQGSTCKHLQILASRVILEHLMGCGPRLACHIDIFKLVVHVENYAYMQANKPPRSSVPVSVPIIASRGDSNRLYTCGG